MIFLAIMNHYKAWLPQDHTMLLVSLQAQVLRIQQRVDGDVIGGYSVVLLGKQS